MGFGYIKDDYKVYLGTGQPLKTNDYLLPFVEDEHPVFLKTSWCIDDRGPSVVARLVATRAG